MEGKYQTVVNDARGSFSEIAKSIQSLKECSNKDFRMLAKCFNESVKSVEKLVDHAKSIFSIVETHNIEKLTAEIRALYNENEDLLKGIRGFQMKMSELRSGTDFMQNLFVVYLENCVQDLKTFSLLRKSVRFSNSAKVSKEYTEALAQISENSERTIGLLKAILQLHSEFRKEFDNCLTFFKDRNFQNLGFIDHPFDEADSDFKQKQNLVREYYPVFAQRESSHKMFFSEIVTNLQYNDIISQKIEHVSEIITDVSVKLKHVKFDAKGGILDLPNVRKAAELQSAQLVQINVDYQEAVKAIFRKLEELADNANDIAMLTNPFYSKQGHSGSYFFDLSQHLSLPKQYFEVVESAYKRVQHLTAKSTKLFSELQVVYADLKKNQDIFSNMESKFVSDLVNDSTIQVIINKADENLKFINDSLQKFLNYSESIVDLFGDVEESSPLSGLKSVYESLMEKVSSLDNKVYQEIDSSMQIVETLKRNLDSLLGNVAYYSLFEKELGSISSELNKILLLIEFNNEEDIPVDEKFFDSLKQYYTMKSEHDIHDTVLLVNGTSNDNIDDIEFF